MNPLLRALRSLGGSGSVEEIYDKVVELENLLDDVLSQFHDPEKSNQTEVAYRLAWARTYLKKYGLLENSTRGVWALTAKAKETEQVDPQDVVKTVRALDKKEAPERRTPGRPPGRGFRRRGVETEATRHPDTEALPPAAFERLFRVFSFSAFEAVLGGGDPKRWGMITMRERAHAIGGTLTIASAPGKGTRIIVAIAR